MSQAARHATNSHILVHRFDYIRPSTLQEAIAALAENGENASVLAGGTNLIVDMKLERVAASSPEPAAPNKTGELPGQLPMGVPSTLVDISRLHELVGISEEAGTIRIGALTSIHSLATSSLLWDAATALAEAAAAFGSTQIAMRGTIGGNVCNGSPASDTVPSLLALEAEAVLVGPDGERTVAVGDLLEGPGKTRVRTGEILKEFRLQAAGALTGSAFLKLSRVRADLSKVSVAVRLVREGAVIRTARIELGSVGPTVLRARKTEGALSGAALSEPSVAGEWQIHQQLLEASRLVAEEVRPIDDIRSTADYRRTASVAVVFDALTVAWRRSDGEWDRPSAARRGELTEPLRQEVLPLQLGAAEKAKIGLTVNGVKQELEVAPNELLLNVLRERLELTGTKYGCGIGECGACTVWLNGEPVLGCLVLAISADGGDVRTIEGEAVDGELSRLQQAFIEENAFQCGYCTPGMLMMTKKLLEEIPEPTEDEVRDYLKGNRCRCTGYASIVRAVQRAAGRDEP